MWYIYVIVGVLILISGISKAIMDKISYHYDKSIFKKLGPFWNPEESWKFKYKNNDPDQGERFLGSTTIFVSLTDAWHLFNLIRNFCLVSAIAVASMNFYFLIGYLIFIGTFHLFFEYAFKSKE